MTASWDAEHRARELIGRRAELLERLPGEIRAAQAVLPDVRELILDEAITFAAVHYDHPITSPQQLEAIVWDACAKRVRRAREGRYDTLRAGWGRASDAALEHVAAGEDPESRVLRRDELRTFLEFATMLTQRERDVLACKYTGGSAEPQGYKQVARHLGISVGAVRAAERSIGHKADRFAVIHSAGRLCSYRMPAVMSLAAGAARADEELAARAHLAHCPPCTAAYTRHVRYLQSAAFQRKLASLLPLPAAASERARGTGSLRDIVGDWLARLFGHDPAATATQVAASGTGRGAGTAAMLKLAAALCLTGAGATCVQTGLVPNPLAHHDKPAVAQKKKSSGTGPARDSAAARAPDARRVAHVSSTPTPTPTPRPKRKRRHSTSQRTTQGGTGPTSHEQTPASPAPADAAPNGGSEFDPTYQPSQPAKPAPVPAAPGSSEFF
jgi:DNA-binding CsgD family transcriptional regulator